MAKATAQRGGKIKLADVARRATLSVATVSMALADHPQISLETRRRVRQLSQEMGYRRPGPKRTEDGRWRGLAGKRIGMFFVGSQIHDSTLVHQITLQTRLADARLELAAVESQSPTDAVAPFAEFARQLDGVIVSGYIGHDLLLKARQLQTPCVVHGSILRTSPVRPRPHGHLVLGDDVNMARMAVDWLQSDEHQRIAFVAEKLPAGLWADRWLTGYRLGHMEHNLALDPSLVLLSNVDYTGGASMADCVLAMPQPPTAYVIPEPRVADTFLRRLAEHHRVPDRRAIVLGKDPVKARVPGLSDLAAIFIEDQRFTEALLDTLARAMAQDLIEGVDLLLSPSVRNPPPRRQETQNS